MLKICRQQWGEDHFSAAVSADKNVHGNLRSKRVRAVETEHSIPRSAPEVYMARGSCMAVIVSSKT